LFWMPCCISMPLHRLCTRLCTLFIKTPPPALKLLHQEAVFNITAWVILYISSFEQRLGLSDHSRFFS